MSSESSSTRSSSVQFGKLAFDIFVLEHWNYDLHPSSDSQQWNSLVSKYLALSDIERQPYFDRLDPVRASSLPLSLPPEPSRENIARALAPHQTPRERLLSARGFGRTQPTLWVRTCYVASLGSSYEQMVQAADIASGVSVESEMMLDDPAIYDFGDEWGKIFLRLPALVEEAGWYDSDGTYYHQDTEDWGDEDAEGVEKILADLTRNARRLIYVVDEEAIRMGEVKMKWVDGKGRCIWWNTITPAGIKDITGLLKGGMGLGEFIGPDFEDQRDGGKGNVGY